MSGDPSTSAATAGAAAAVLKPPETETFSIIEEIGTGAYGTVYKARSKATREFVALKKIIVSHSSEEGMPLSTIREIAMLKQLSNVQHENIVKLIDVVHGPKVSDTEVELSLVFEYIDQDMAMYLSHCPSPGLEKERIKDLSQQLLTGIDFLHSNRIVHRDLKPQNILITGTGKLKVADFGLARIYGFNMALTQVVVTLWYRSPEVLLQTSYALPVDMWSVGCIFAELHTRRPLFCGKSDIDQLRKIFDIIGLPDRSEWPEDVSIPWTSFSVSAPRLFREVIYNLSPSAEDLLKILCCYKTRSLSLFDLQRLLTFDPNIRITAAEALDHSYFKDGDDDSDEESESDEEEEEEDDDDDDDDDNHGDGDEGTTKETEVTEKSDTSTSAVSLTAASSKESAESQSKS